MNDDDKATCPICKNKLNEHSVWNYLHALIRIFKLYAYFCQSMSDIVSLFYFLESEHLLRALL